VAESRRTVIRPVVTEKSVGRTAASQYTFHVDTKASKHHIKAAIEQIFKVKVLRVNTVTVHGKRKRDLRRRTMKPTVQHPDRKMAVVTLREGDKIELGGVNYFES
jgi:large subunit ribosomal protein L23